MMTRLIGLLPSERSERRQMAVLATLTFANAVCVAMLAALIHRRPETSERRGSDR
ncbi:MAG: hypothetical protein ACP5UQ_07935 [Anaerolineae bacterium]